MSGDAGVTKLAGGTRLARLDSVVFDVAAQDLLDNQQGRGDLPAFDLGEAGFVDSTRLPPAMAQLRDISSPRQHAACRLQARPRIFMPPTAVDGQEIFRPLSG